MYHKVNDQHPNPITVPTAMFAEQMTLLGRARIHAGLPRRRSATTISQARPFRQRAVLITFDDGYLDNLENARTDPVDRRLPGRDLRSGRLPRPRRAAAPARGEPLSRWAIRNPTLEWSQLADLEDRRHPRSSRTASAIAVSPSSIRTRRCREIAISKLRLEEVLGRQVEAYAYVKGSRADYRAEHASLVQQAGYKLGFSAVSGVNEPSSDRFQLLRYNVEPYSAAHVRARARGVVRRPLAEGHGARHARAAHADAAARNRHRGECRGRPLRARVAPVARRAARTCGNDAAERRGVRLVVRSQSGRRGDRLARGRRGRGRRRRGDELLQDAARGRRDAARHPGERRDGRALPRAGRLLDAAAGERGGRCCVGLASDRHLPEREVLPDLHPAARVGGPPALAALGPPAPGLPASSGTRSGGRGAGRHAGGRHDAPHAPRRSRCARSSALAPRWTRSAHEPRRATAAISPAMRSTSTGAISTRRATTAASALTATASSRASWSSVTRSSTACPPASSPTSWQRRTTRARFGRSCPARRPR